MKREKLNIKKKIKRKIELRLNKNNKLVTMNEREKLRNSNEKNVNLIDVKSFSRNEIRTGANLIPSINRDLYSIDSYIKILNEDIESPDNIKILFLISNYERKRMLNKLINEIQKFNSNHIIIDYMIFDDCSSYEINDKNLIINKTHRGKEEYWITFNEMFKYAEKHVYDIYVFTPNDFLKYDFEKIINYGIKFKNIPYVFNIINDGREKCWNNIMPIILTEEIRLQFFTDCGFFTNYETLSKLSFTVNEIPIRGKLIGSQVGAQLTDRLNSQYIPIFTPIKSIAYHGEHLSLMNPELRKENKLISL